MGFKRKFQIGDKVQIIKPNDVRNNQIGKIRSYHPNYGSKGFYRVNFENGVRDYYSYELEKVEDSSNTKSNKLSISDLKPGMKVRIRPDLEEGQSTVVYINNDMKNYAGTIATIESNNSSITGDRYQYVYLKNIPYVWDIDCFSEIIKESEEETTTSEKIKFPLKEGQVVTLLDGKQYQVINNRRLGKCSLCSLGSLGCNNCSICYINGIESCAKILPKYHYFKLVKDNKKENKSSSKSLTISDFKVGMKVRVKENFDEITTIPDYISNISTKMRTFKGKELVIENIGNNSIIAKSYCWLPEWLEIVDESNNSSNFVKESSVKEVGIITKVNFTLTDFKPEELEHSKFTIL